MRFLRVTHSIPDGMAVAIDTPFGTVLHSGDFKLDQTPLDDRPTDLQAFAEEGRRGVHLFLSDSTNAEDPGVIASERTIGPVLADIIREAAREHKWVKLVPGDTVVLSSSLIPGNEPAIHRVIDGLYRTGAEVFHVPIAPVHVSGHAASDELKTILNLVKPRWFIPVHGER